MDKLETKIEKLSGPTVVGKIELPVDKKKTAADNQTIANVSASASQKLTSNVKPARLEDNVAIEGTDDAMSPRRKSAKRTSRKKLRKRSRD